MHIDQRYVTTIDLHDGKVRDFVLLRDGAGYKLSGVSGDDVLHVQLSYQDLYRLRQELVRPAAERERSPERSTGAAAFGGTGYTWGAVRVEQRHVTTVSLQAGKLHDVLLRRDDRGYKLSCVSPDEVVTLLLPAHDLGKLRDVLRRDAEADAAPTESAAPVNTGVLAAAHPGLRLDWLSFN